MSTNLQILTNQQNSQLYTGPKTEEGKAVSSQNRRTHGLPYTGANFKVLPDESQEISTTSSPASLANTIPPRPLNWFWSGIWESMPPGKQEAAAVEEPSYRGRAGRNTPCPSSAMSSGRLFLDGVLASRARLHFTGCAR